MLLQSLTTAVATTTALSPHAQVVLHTSRVWSELRLCYARLPHSACLPSRMPCPLLLLRMDAFPCGAGVRLLHVPYTLPATCCANTLLHFTPSCWALVHAHLALCHCHCWILSLSLLFSSWLCGMLLLCSCHFFWCCGLTVGHPWLATPFLGSAILYKHGLLTHSAVTSSRLRYAHYSCTTYSTFFLDCNSCSLLRAQDGHDCTHFHSRTVQSPHYVHTAHCTHHYHTHPPPCHYLPHHCTFTTSTAHTSTSTLPSPLSHLPHTSSCHTPHLPSRTLWWRSPHQ